MRIHIIGTAGAGKTTLARQLAEHFACPHIELDALHWAANWQHTPSDLFRAKVCCSLAKERWVIDGDYQTVRDLIWNRVNMVIWLDYSAALLCWRLTKRGIRHLIKQENLWGTGNYESWQSLLSRRSIIVRALADHAQWRARYAAMACSSEFGHIQFIRLRSARATAQWLQNFTAPKTAMPLDACHFVY